jgi:hypothetical protein
LAGLTQTFSRTEELDLGIGGRFAAGLDRDFHWGPSERAS